MIDYVNTEELSFADWLSQTMTDNKLNASQLSRAIEVNRSTISLWLSGDRLPKDNLRARLAKYFVSLGMWSYSPMIREILWRVHVSQMRKNK